MRICLYRQRLAVAEKLVTLGASNEFGVRRQRRRFGFAGISTTYQSKAVSRCACHRTPNEFFSSLLGFERSFVGLGTVILHKLDYKGSKGHQQ
jgi:hypothetical protein